MDVWDLESRLSTLTGGSCETLDDLDRLPLDGVHQERYDLLGLEVSSMELWDDTHNDLVNGFGFCGKTETPYNKETQNKETRPNCSPSLHVDSPSHVKRETFSMPSPSPPRVALKHVKSVDDYDHVTRAPTPPVRRRYRKHGKHGRYATTDVTYIQSRAAETSVGNESVAFYSGSERARSLDCLERDGGDNGSTTNLFVSGNPDLHHRQQSTSPSMYPKNPYASKELLFPYVIVKGKSSSCDELSSGPKPFNRKTRSQSQYFRVDTSPNAVTSTNPNGKNRGPCNGAAWTQRKAGSSGSTSCREGALNTGGPGKDLTKMSNVKVIATESYTARGAQELSLKKGQKLKLKSHSMDGDFAFGWKRSSRLAPKKYGYFPTSHVTLYEK